MRIVGSEGSNGGKGKSLLLKVSMERRAAGAGHVIKVSGPQPIVLNHLRNHVPDPFRQLLMVGFNPDDLRQMGCRVVSTVEIVYLQNQIEAEIQIRPEDNVQLVSPGFCYLSLIGSLLDVNVVAGACGFERPSLGDLAQRLHTVLFDEKGYVRGSGGLVNTLPLLSPQGPWWLYGWSSERNLQGLFPVRYASPEHARLMVVGREVVVNAVIGSKGKDVRMVTSRDIIDLLGEERGKDPDWRRVLIGGSPSAVSDISVESVRKEPAVLAITFEEGTVKRFSFERYTSTIDPIINDGPTPSAATIVRLPEVVFGDLIDTPRSMRVRRSIAPRGHGREHRVHA
ncbi:MAG: hypothetical protein UY77_C0006G0008 [Candidatus Uhrbacteria bacterium GW2011_GWA2_53_10]|uniref:Uncharacterized protein n=1 Tax=Candidatus Uhrbacteria bacterium GW2011_GWA2_53_10 TaxID=1618980 RepID=A0A0G1XQ61_9BACT|nr:MAG: hypothetical protein UY77_C0006G0008 [Candidatus Uhrbacteria bacterium GW2011_GWA2_53_10]